MYYYNGDIYVGTWSHDKREGKGRYTYAQGTAYYEGLWKNDMKEGFGVFDWKDGNRYEGHWHENQKHGKGTFTYVDFPEVLRGKYQFFTESDNSKLLEAGYDKGFYDFEEAVAEYVDILDDGGYFSYV